MTDDRSDQQAPWWRKAIGTPRWWLVNGAAIALFLVAVAVIFPD